MEVQRMKKKEAVELFVNRDLNAIPLALVERAYKEEGLYSYIVQPVEPKIEDYDIEDEEEPVFADDEPQVDDFELEVDFDNAVIEYFHAKQKYEKDLEKWQEYQDARREWESKCEDYYPMWGTLFEVGDSWLGEWILDHLEEVQNIGFIVIDGLEELNVCLGVGGCGYSFYDMHWTPLYDLLGLKWHDIESEESK